MITHAIAPLAREHGVLITLFKSQTGPANVPKVFSGWARCHYRKVIRKLWAVLSDLSVLRQIGVTVDVGDERSTTRASKTAFDDTVCCELFRIIAYLVKHRALEGIHQSQDLPGNLAGLLHEELAHRIATREELTEAAGLFAMSETCPDPTVQEWRTRSMWLTPIGRICMLFCLHGSNADWSLFEEFVKDLFSSCGVNKLVEDANQVVRMKEILQRSSPVMKNTIVWSEPRTHGVAGTYGLEETPLGTSTPAPSDPEDGMFRISEESALSEGRPLKNVTTDTPDWPTRKPDTSHHLLAEKYLVETMSASSRWRAWKVWRASMVPEMQILQSVAAQQPFFSLYVCPKKAVLGFDVTLQPGGYMCPPVEGGSFVEKWYLIDDLNDLEVLSSTPVSPQTRKLGGFTRTASKRLDGAGNFKQGTGNGVALQVYGAGVPLKVWQAKAGFAGVDRETLQKVMDDEVPPVSDELRDAAEYHGAFSAEDGLALALVLHFLPRLTREEQGMSTQLAAAPLPVAHSHRAAAAVWRKLRPARLAEACKPQPPAPEPLPQPVLCDLQSSILAISQPIRSTLIVAGAASPRPI